MEETQWYTTKPLNTRKRITWASMIASLLLTQPTQAQHSPDYEQTLPMSVKTIVDLAIPSIQQAYKEHHKELDANVQINIIPNTHLYQQGWIHNSTNNQASYWLNTHHFGAAIDTELTINNKKIKLHSKEGMRYATIIYNIAHGMWLSAFITDENQIHICVTRGVVKLLRYYPELYNHPAVEGFYNHFKHSKILDQSYKELMSLLDRYFNDGKDIPRNYIAEDDYWFPTGNGSTYKSPSSGLLNSEFSSSSH